MNKFEIMAKLGQFRLREHTGDYSLSFVEDNIKIEWHTHSTGEGLRMWLIDGDEFLHVYYDYNWFSERYEFNEVGKKHGYLIDDAPWNIIIEAKFLQFEKEIISEEERRAEEKRKSDAEISLAEQKKLDRFKEKFSHA